MPHTGGCDKFTDSREQQHRLLLSVVLAERDDRDPFVFPARGGIDIAVQPTFDRNQVMRGNHGTVPLADGQEPVLPIVLGNTHTPVNTTKYIIGPVWVDSAIPVESENAWHLPAATENRGAVAEGVERRALKLVGSASCC